MPVLERSAFRVIMVNRRRDRLAIQNLYNILFNIFRGEGEGTKLDDREGVGDDDQQGVGRY